MKTITLRNLSPELARLVRRRAQERGTSLARAVVGLLEERLGIRGGGAAPAVHDDLDALAGSWTDEEAACFEKALAEQRPIDPELWR